MIWMRLSFGECHPRKQRVTHSGFTFFVVFVRIQRGKRSWSKSATITEAVFLHEWESQGQKAEILETSTLIAQPQTPNATALILEAPAKG